MGLARCQHDWLGGSALGIVNRKQGRLIDCADRVADRLAHAGSKEAALRKIRSSSNGLHTLSAAVRMRAYRVAAPDSLDTFRSANFTLTCKGSPSDARDTVAMPHVRTAKIVAASTRVTWWKCSLSSPGGRLRVVGVGRSAVRFTASPIQTRLRGESRTCRPINISGRRGMNNRKRYLGPAGPSRTPGPRWVSSPNSSDGYRRASRGARRAVCRRLRRAAPAGASAAARRRAQHGAGHDLSRARVVFAIRACRGASRRGSARVFRLRLAGDAFGDRQ